MLLRPKRSSHPGYIDTGGPPREPATPGAKRKKESAKEKKEKKAKSKTKALKKIATIEKANTVAYANDETPRSTQMSRASGRKQSKAQELGEYRTVSPLNPHLSSHLQGQILRTPTLVADPMTRSPIFHPSKGPNRRLTLSIRSRRSRKGRPMFVNILRT